jgi:hypothetical protein
MEEMFYLKGRILFGPHSSRGIVLSFRITPMKKRISTARMALAESRMPSGHPNAALTFYSNKRKGLFQHVEAHESAYDSGSADGTRAPVRVDTNDTYDERTGGSNYAASRDDYDLGPGHDRQVAGDQG